MISSRLWSAQAAVICSSNQACPDITPLCPHGNIIEPDFSGSCCRTCGPSTVPNCPVSGQVFSTCSSSCTATCAEPTPVCSPSLLCIARCECPPGTVLNEAAKACVPKEQCGRIGIISSGCPLDKPPVACFLDPCQFAQCSNHLGARCVLNNCGSCTATFFDSKGIDITNSCSE